jgi:hypothetical protein
MASKLQIDTALALLTNAGHNVGVASVKNGVVYILIDRAPRTFEEVFLMAEAVKRTTGAS